MITAKLHFFSKFLILFYNYLNITIKMEFFLLIVLYQFLLLFVFFFPHLLLHHHLALSISIYLSIIPKIIIKKLQYSLICIKHLLQSNLHQLVTFLLKINRSLLLFLHSAHISLFYLLFYLLTLLSYISFKTHL